MLNKYIKLKDGSIFKIGNPTRRHYIIKSIQSKRYLGYSLIREVLLSISRAIDELASEKELNEILRESLTFYIIIVYGKCFADTDQ